MFRFDSNLCWGDVATAADFWRVVGDVVGIGYSENDAISYLLGQPEKSPGVFGYYNRDLSARPFREVCPPEWLVRPSGGEG
jgi:hypothetical protein